jgi:hypothetical protein
MTSFELLSRIESILFSFKSVTELHAALLAMAQADENMEGLTVVISTASGNIVSASVAEFQDAVNNQNSSLRELHPIIIIKQVSDLESAIHELRLLTDKDKQGTYGNVGIRLSNFVSAYEQFIMTYSSTSTLRLLRTAHDLYTSLQTAMEMLEGTARNLEQPYEGENDDQISILLHPDDEVSIYADKLEALVIIYEELCRLLNVSLAEHPLRVIKVESGSLWAKLFGESKVVTLMTDLIRAGVYYLHRSYTSEGKISTVPKNIEVVESLLNLERRMQELGYDTTDMREDIQKTSSVIAKQLNILLKGEANVELNGERYSVGSAIDRQIAEKSKTLLLGEGTTETPELTDGRSDE